MRNDVFTENALQTILLTQDISNNFRSFLWKTINIVTSADSFRISEPQHLSQNLNRLWLERKWKPFWNGLATM